MEGVEGEGPPPSSIGSPADPVSPDTSGAGVEVSTQYDQNMVAEPNRSDEEIAKIVSMVVQGLLPQLQKPSSEERREVKEERGEVAVFRMWMFNLGVALSQVDSKLGEEVRNLMSREDAKSFPHDWDPSKDEQVDQYHRHLGSLGIMRGLQDTQFPSDGYKALVSLSQRFDVKTNSSMLSSFLEVVSPKVAKDKEPIPAIHLWERKVADLRSRYGEEIKGNLKLIVFLSMLPKDYQEEILKMGSGDNKLEYEKVRSYVLSLAQQRASSMNPRSSEIQGVDTPSSEGGNEEEEEMTSSVVRSGSNGCGTMTLEQ
eukprot:12068536-Karenia_brevis.AAC.1